VVVELIPFAALFGFVMLVLYLAHAGQLKQQSELEAFARRLDNGTIRGRVSMLGSPDVTVEGFQGDRQVRVRVYVVGSGKSAQTMINFQVDAPNALADFEITKTNVFNRMGRAIGVVSDTSVGDARIDKKYILAGRAPSLRELFQRSPKLEWCFDELFDRHGLSKIKLRWSKISSERLFGTANAARLLETVRALSRVASLCEREEVHTKIKILGEQKAFAWTYGGKGARCPYCRDDVDPQGDDVTACPACRTLHHEECLDEAGGCTVLGCTNSKAGRRVEA
jgi:HAMP domain-containing protein